MRKKRTLFFAFVISVVSLIIRMYEIETIPRNLNPDEADNLMTYIIESHNSTLPLIGINWNGAPLINNAIQGFFWEISGESISGLRFPSVLFSTLSVLLFFIIGLQITQNNILSFCFAIALSTNAWFLNFSRSSWENIYTSIPVLIGIWAGIILYKKKNPNTALIFFVISSILGFYSYHTGKFIPIASAILCLGTLFIHKTKIMHRTRGMFFAACIIILVISPQLLISIKDFQKASHRIANVSIFNQANKVEIHNHVINNLRGFAFYDARSFHYGTWSRYVPPERPLIPPLVTLFYLIGIVFSFQKLRWLFLYFIILIIPVQILSYPTPDAARAVHIVPVLYLFSLIGMHISYKFFARLLNKKQQIFPHLLTGISCTMLLLTSVLEATTYFRWIQRTDIIEARKPAIDYKEFSSWIKSAKESAKTGRRFTIDEWHKEIFHRKEI